MVTLAAKKEKFKTTDAGRALDEAKLGQNTTEYLMDVQVEPDGKVVCVLDPTDAEFNLTGVGNASIAYINEPKAGTHANAEYEFIKTAMGTNGVGVFATRPIKAGDEILVDYGDSYDRSYIRT
jgi:hypothetical protein